MKKKWKEPKTAEEHREYALVFLDMTCDFYHEVVQLGDKPVPLKLAKKCFQTMGMACQHWRKFTTMSENEMINKMMMTSGWVGNVKTSKLAAGEPVKTKQKLWPNTVGDFKRVEPADCGVPCDPKKKK